MRARAVLLPLVAVLAMGTAAPTLAHHDCGNQKSQDQKEREACEKERERRQKEHEQRAKDEEKRRKGDKGGKDKGKGKGGGSASQPPPPPREEWTERETARTEIAVSVSAELVADWVPRRYQVALSGGEATLLITARTFAGEGGAQTVVHEASVVVTSPDGTAGVHSYLLWQVTDAQWLGAKLQRVGLPVHVLSAPYSDTSAGLAAEVRGEVALGDVAYSFQGSVRESAGAATGTPSVVWYDGFLGTVRAGTTCAPCGTPGTGAVVVTADAASRVSTYLSAEAAVTPASFVRSSGVTVAAVVA